MAQTVAPSSAILSLPNPIQLLKAAAAEQRATQTEQQVTELNRVLQETAASYQELQQEHATALDELALYKRWVFGRRRERFMEAGQDHLFDLETSTNGLEATAQQQELETQAADREVTSDRRRQKRQIDWDNSYVKLS